MLITVLMISLLKLLSFSVFNEVWGGGGWGRVGAGEELIPKPAVFQVDQHLTTEYIFISRLQILHFVSKHFSV